MQKNASSINNKRDMLFSRETTGNITTANTESPSLTSNNTNSSSVKDYYSSYSRTRDANTYLSSLTGASTTNSTTSGVTSMATSATTAVGNGSANGGSITNSSGANDVLKAATAVTKDGLDKPVGCSDIATQIHRKISRKGFEFTLLVVGESGMGKSTLVNSLFFSNIYSDEYPGPSKRATKTLQVETTKLLLKQKTVNFQLTIVDTPGYGTAVDNSNCWQPVLDYIEAKFEEYLKAETSLYRSQIEDNRVHCCLYFIYPSGHSMKPLDIEFMQHLHDKVNIIPVIAKADTLTPDECAQFKKNVLQELAQHQIKYYDFPVGESDEDTELTKQLRNRLPFAVCGSNYVIDVNGEKKRCRKYPWGVVEVDNLEHCDLQALRDMMVRTYLFDLICTTNDSHYENYRCRKLSVIGGDRKLNSKEPTRNPLAQMEEEKKESEARMKKMEQEMEQVFEVKVKEKLQKLRDSESDMQRRHEQMIRNLEKERIELEEKRQAFEKERAAFELISKDMEEMLRVSTLEANSRESLDKDKKKEKKKGLF